MLKMKSWSTARIIFRDLCVVKENEKETGNHTGRPPSRVEPKKIAQRSVQRY